MNFRVRSRAKAGEIDQVTNRLKFKTIKINEVLEFDHNPSGDEIQAALENIPKYRSRTLQFLETLAVQKLPD